MNTFTSKSINNHSEMALTENQVEDIIATALIKAWEDENFKEELLATPIDTIEKLTGERISFKDGQTTSIVESPKIESFDLAIPAYVSIDDTELSEQELELVTGGGTPNFKSQEDFVTFLEAYL